MAKASSLLLLILVLVCGLLAYLYYDACMGNQQLEVKMNELQKQIQSLRIDKEYTANKLSTANGRLLQLSHELEAEKSEVKVKNAETKKLTERINTMKNEQDMSEQARITAERKMQSAEGELQEVKDRLKKTIERAQVKEDNLEELRSEHEDVTSKLRGCLHEKEELERQLQAYEKAHVEEIQIHHNQAHHRGTLPQEQDTEKSDNL